MPRQPAKKKSTRKTTKSTKSVASRPALIASKPANRLVFLVVAVLAVVVGVKIVFFSHAASSFTPVGPVGSAGTFAPAAAQPTALGQTIQSLVAWNGKIYAGYGDYDVNTGPIAFVPFDPVTNTFAAAAENAPCSATSYPASGTGCDRTEEIDGFRIMNGNLYAPSIDPQGFTNTDNIEATVSNGSVTWAQHELAPGGVFQHTFDMNTMTGLPNDSDLWQVGSFVPKYFLDSSGNPTTVLNNNGTSCAVAYRSLDAGATWQQQKGSIVCPQSTTSCGICDVRYYMALPYTKPGTSDPKLFLQPVIAGSALGSSMIFDSASGSWTKGPAFPFDGGFPSVFNNTATGVNTTVFQTQAPGQVVFSSIRTFDYSVDSAGRYTYSIPSIDPTSSTYFYAYTIDGSGASTTLYGIANDGHVYSTKDLKTWYDDGIAPSTARSIAILSGTIYVGTTDSKIYSAAVPANPIPVPVSNTGGGGGKPCHGKNC